MKRRAMVPRSVVWMGLVWASAGCSQPAAASAPAMVATPPGPRLSTAAPRKAAPLGVEEVRTGTIRRHERAGTKEEMLTGRYHLYTDSGALWLEPGPGLSEADFDAAEGKRVALTVRQRDDAADDSNPNGEQRPVDGLPARTVYVVSKLVVTR